MVCSAWLLVVGDQVHGSRLSVQEEGCCTTEVANPRRCWPATGRQRRGCIIPQAVTQSCAPEDGQNNCPKHVELTGTINKPLLLHLVGCLYCLYRLSQEECARLREGVPYDKYTDITQNTYVQSWTVTEIMAREKCGLLARPHTTCQLTVSVLACGVKLRLGSRDKRLHMGLTLTSG